MLVKIKLKGDEVFPSQIKGRLAYEKNVIMIFKSQGRVLFVDYVKEGSLGSYEIPPFLKNRMLTIQIVLVPEEYSNYIRCIAGEIQNKLYPLFRNKNLACNSELTVILE
ncbi:MAG: hypothetical protein QXH43_09140 [Metallosphaera sp.]|uniref:hypothetical protein n=1 Tax=Metallosphaera sp. TaxID=2020860 RepID=UPI00317A019C